MRITLFTFFFLLTPPAWSDGIPKAAWKRPIGEPLANPGTRKQDLDAGHIDDGFWQGAPVGGIGAGTFSRSYRGNFERWHIKAGVHKYQNVPANQFAVFVQPEGEPAMAQVLSTGKPEGSALSSWNWSYPAGGGEYAALYPKSWFAYRSPQLPITLTVEQFSPILPNNYKETSYPVAVYNWYAENPSTKAGDDLAFIFMDQHGGLVSRHASNFHAVLNAQNKNVFRSEPLTDAKMQGIVFDRIRSGPVADEWDGQFAIAALASAGWRSVTLPISTRNGSGAEVWHPFSATGRLPSQSVS